MQDMKGKFKMVCPSLLSDLNPRTRDVLQRRYGLTSLPPQTLEAIGRDFGITRERVRQITDDGMIQIQRRIQDDSRHSEPFKYLLGMLKRSGQLRREDVFVRDAILEPSENPNHAVFLLHLGSDFAKHKESLDTHAFWTTNKEALNELVSALNTIKTYFEQKKEVASIEEIAKLYNSKFKNNTTKQQLMSYLEISKDIMQSPEGSWGLSKWPEVNPKGIRDKAYLVLRASKKPVHFTEVAKMIEEFQKTFSLGSKKACLPQTVHNELIKDKRFILVGRGTYGLSDWGLKSGTVKDVIINVLSGSGRAMTKDDIIKKVLKERAVKENTIVLNLQNKKYFTKDSKGKYKLKA